MRSIDTLFYNEFSETQPSPFLKKIVTCQGPIDLRLYKKSWRSLNCSPKTMKEIRDPGKPPLCWEDEGDDHEEVVSDDMFVQPNRGRVEREAHYEQLQEGGF